MIIGIDGNEGNVFQRVGVGQYVFHLLSSLYTREEILRRNAQRDVSYLIYLKSAPLPDFPRPRPWWRYRVFGPSRFWTRCALPLHLYLDREVPNVFFTPSHYAPLFSPVPYALSIMDLSFFHYPELFRTRDLQQLLRWTKRSVRNARAIFTISEFSKQEIVSRYGVPPAQIVVTYPGYDRNVFTVKPREETKRFLEEKYSVHGPYVLYVGTLQPRKNITGLIHAFSSLLARSRDFDERKRRMLRDFSLVLVGKKGWMYDEIFSSVRTSPIQTHIRFVDYVPFSDLPYFYSGASCFVLPSLSEGFGLTLVEAMACGCPVAASKISSIPEVVGDAGHLFSPQDTSEIAHAIEVLIFDVLIRKQFVARGLQRVSLFDWSLCAEKTYNTLVGLSR